VQYLVSVYPQAGVCVKRGKVITMAALPIVYALLDSAVCPVVIAYVKITQSPIVTVKDLVKQGTPV